MIRDQIASLGLPTADEVDRVVEGFRTAPSLVGRHRPLDYTGDVQLFGQPRTRVTRGRWHRRGVPLSPGDPRGPRRHLPISGWPTGSRSRVIGPELSRALDAADAVPRRSVHGPPTPAI